ncbi:MAG: MarR family transcriptional regulator [Clostridia bacterium]|nr:MarR family transcriptional regulator [Clostridia bacterium]
MQTAEEYSARETIHNLLTTMRKHRRIFDTVRARTGLGRSAHRMLMILSENPDGCAQARLAEVLEISPAAVTVILKKLEAEGYILRTVNPADSRLNTTELTEKGKTIVVESHKTFTEIDDAVFEEFTKAEMETLNGFLQRMQTNMETFETGKDDAH